MPEADVLAAFPRRPLKVRAGWRSTLGSLAAASAVLACLGGAAYFAWSEGRKLLQEARIWDTGRPVPALALPHPVGAGAMRRGRILRG